MNNPALLIIAAFGLVCSAIAIYYIIRVKNAFASLPRLERPWLLLELGVASLFVAALAISLSELSPSFGFSHLIQVVAAVLSAFFILTAMVTMKQAWTIREGD
jgi:CBS domain containing-hemolysin-like protein